MRPKIDRQITFFYTQDLPKTAHFYETIIQLPLVLDQGPCRIYHTNDSSYVGFCETCSSELPTKNVIFTLVTEDVDKWYEFLKTKDVHIEKPPLLNEKFNIYHLFLRDPNGYLIEIQRFVDPLWYEIPTS